MRKLRQLLAEGEEQPLENYANQTKQKKKGKRKMIRNANLTIEKNETGGLVITALVNGYLMTRHFYYYSKKEAAGLFLLEANGNKERQLTK
jgi:hypothetical protein